MPTAVHHLSIDIETYSDVDITKTGLYRYAQRPAFSILLFAYSLDFGPVQVIDLASGGPGSCFPVWLHHALKDPSYIKHAYNAPFEWYCLCQFFRWDPAREGAAFLTQWRCTMLHGLYCGFPGGLEAVGKALGLPQDKQKLSTGKALIRYFCTPCAPTRTNGQRTRNMPHHDPAKWELFKTYNAQDVVTEMEVERRLSPFPVPEAVQAQWVTDQIINCRGVGVDMDLVGGALELDAAVRAQYLAEAAELSGLDNPNSVGKLTKWLQAELAEEDIPNLNKETVTRLLGKDLSSEDARRMLELRQELGKTSNKKYNALETAVCADGRVRGLLQFYGAARTGRWCLTGDHEVLTPTGWMRLDEWHGGPIACWQPYGEAVSFQDADQVSFDYDGPMYEYRDKRISQKSTPDHKMCVRRAYRGEWISDTVKNMQSYRPAIPFTGWRRTTPGREYWNLRVLVMVQADGYYTEDGTIRFAFRKKRKIERCKHLLRRADIPFVDRTYPDRTVILVPSRTVPLWLRQFRDKTFGPWLFDESPDVFFDELPHWDGYHSAKNSVQYTTCNKVNADIVQAFAHMSGRAALLRVRQRSDEHPNWKDSYVVDIWQSPGNCHEIRTKSDISEYSGKVYCAVTKTGYFLVRRDGRVWVTGNSGRIVQPQNLPRTYIKPELLPLARELTARRELDGLRLVFGSVSDTLSQLIRTALVAAPGCTLVDADFSSIEARVLAWLAGEEWALEVFRTHGRIYEATAAQLYDVPIEKIVKGRPEYALRQYGKAATLALGYGGGAEALINAGHLDRDTPEEKLLDIRDRWRRKNPAIVNFWYMIDAAAKEAVQTGRRVELQNGRLVFARECDPAEELDFLTIRLPSSRKLYYTRPHMGSNRFGQPCVCHWGKRGQGGKWQVLETYGGGLTENIAQPVARDCLAEAIDRVEAAGYPVVFHIHDEIVTEVPGGTRADLDQITQLMGQVPAWAPGLPLRAEGWVNPFFKKE